MTFWALFRKEIHAYFVSPSFYVLAAVFLSLSGFFFYTQMIYFVQYGFGLNIVGSLWVAFLAGAPYSVSMVLLLTTPLLTMRLFAEEKRLGTFELLLTYPLRDGVLVAAKFAACTVVVAILLAGTLLYPYVLQGANDISWGPVACGYLGLILLGVSFIACGMFVSSLTDSQVVAAVATLGILLLFWMLTWNEAATDVFVLRALAPLAMFDHFERFARGVIDVGDLAYFACFTTFFTFLTLRVLEARQWRGPR